MNLKYILRRLTLSIFIMLGVVSIVFVISHVIPGDPAAVMAGREAGKEAIQKIRQEFGLDKPLFVQYVIYLQQLIFHQNLGKSIHTWRPVSQDIREYFPATLELVTFSMVLTLCIGIFLGVLSAVKKEKIPDHLTRLMALSGVSVPIFWLGLLLQFFLCYIFKVFPLNERVSINVITAYPLHKITGIYLLDGILTLNWPVFKDSLLHLLLPALTLSYGSSAQIIRMTRTSMLEVLNKDYIRAARAAGISFTKVVFVHALRNAILPTLTLGGMVYGYLLGGTVLIETIFSWPGLGRYMVDSIFTLDFPAIIGVTLLYSGIVVILNIVVDIIYLSINPRIRL
jgi:ABC-type dipeptide/oligopeptide/nickel transport system permease component